MGEVLHLMDLKKTALTKSYKRHLMVFTIILSILLFLMMDGQVDRYNQAKFIQEEILNLTCPEIDNRSTFVLVEDIGAIGEHQKYLMLYMHKCATNGSDSGLSPLFPENLGMPPKEPVRGGI
jgi:hypothetical protein